MQTKPQTLSEAFAAYLATKARTPNTRRTYHNGLNSFAHTLRANGLPPETTPPEALPEDAIAWFATALKDLMPATEQLYLVAARRFYRFLVAENLATINLTRLDMLLDDYTASPPPRLPQFPRIAIEKLINYAINLALQPSEAPGDCVPERLRNLRDRAFLVTLADTGLRVHEACAMRRGDVDWNEGKAVIKIKGGRQAVIRFSNRALAALRDYLSTRSILDGASGRQLSVLPLFARHDKGAGKKVKPISTVTGRNIVTERVTEALGREAVGTITPHSFRHYFVTTVLRASGNLKLAQELARHSNIAVTQRYAHISDDELDQGYADIFDASHT